MTNLRPSGHRLRKMFQNDATQIRARFLTQAGCVRKHLYSSKLEKDWRTFLRESDLGSLLAST